MVAEKLLPLDLFMKSIEISQQDIIRVEGTAVFMTSNSNIIPITLLHHFKHNKVLHEKIILLSIETEKIPKVSANKRIKIKPLGYGFYQITAYYGYMEKPDIPKILDECNKKKIKGDSINIDVEYVSYYLGRVTLLKTGKSKMFGWQKDLFSYISNNEKPASAFFEIPANRVVELGVQIEI
jgi:KUP system potassium uptake protein